ncbi:MAG: hypothetical protein HY901_24075 [Deltaproteobacteria bacterium]|nr:hypothetical protein [Deltaproteobacteria bacterium]
MAFEGVCDRVESLGLVGSGYREVAATEPARETRGRLAAQGDETAILGPSPPPITFSQRTGSLGPGAGSRTLADAMRTAGCSSVRLELEPAGEGQGWRRWP